jgi:hypothetical protein
MSAPGAPAPWPSPNAPLLFRILPFRFEIA